MSDSDVDDQTLVTVPFASGLRRPARLTTTGGPVTTVPDTRVWRGRPRIR